VRFLLFACLAALGAQACLAAEKETLPAWIIASADGRARAGERFELIVIGPAGEALPDELPVRLKAGADERILTLHSVGLPTAAQRVYAADMPANLAGPVSVELVGRASSVLSLLVTGTPDTLHALTGAYGDPRVEPPLSENDPMYFVVGASDGWNARFQLSFKFRLFDQASGFGKDRPWLSGLYFGYTQNSLWEIDADSQQLRDTSYRPSLFWRWERTDEKTWVDGLRTGVEHESNGKDGDRSRSVYTLFVRPEWRWKLRDGGSFEFTPKIYGYLDKEENPDIPQYRGYVDWRFRYDAGGEWITTPVLRIGTSGKGSLAVDVSKRIRDLKFGPVGGYLHFQYFTGYGEDILDYNVRRPAQLRIGFAIVP
jgi:phospholipase A1